MGKRSLLTVFGSAFLFWVVHQRIATLIRTVGTLSQIADALEESPLGTVWPVTFAINGVLRHAAAPGVLAAQLLFGTLLYTALGKMVKRAERRCGAEAVDTTSRAHAAFRERHTFWKTAKAAASRLQVIQRLDTHGVGPNPSQPFMNRTYYVGPLQRAKMAFVGVTLFPVRLVVFFIGALGMFLFPTLSMLGMSPQEMAKPFPPLRAAIRSLVYPSFRTCVFALGYHWIGSSGAPRSTYAEAPIIVPNHSSFADMVIGYLMGATGVSKKENIKNPLVSKAFLAMQVLLVDRDSAASREKTKAELKRRTTAGATSGGATYLQTIIFPEGTCSNRTTLLAFKAGAFALGVPVQPVAVRYPWRSWDPSLVRGGADLPLLLLGLMCQFHNSMNVTYLPVYSPSEAEIADALLCVQLRRWTLPTRSPGLHAHPLLPPSLPPSLPPFLRPSQLREQRAGGDPERAGLRRSARAALVLRRALHGDRPQEVQAARARV